MAKDINNIHDKFFKELMADRQNAIDFMQFFLPDSILKHIDIQSLEHQKNSFIAPDLKEVFSDAIFSIKLLNSEEALLISILLEHKSIKDEHTPFQILSYLGQGYQSQIKQKKTLKIILPFIFYHGKANWELKKIPDFFSNYPNELISFIPHFDIFFVDLKKLEDTEIFKIMNTFLSAALIVQKYSGSPKELEKQFIRILNTISHLTNRNFFVTLVVYFFNNSKFNITELVELMEHIPQNIKKEIMNTYDFIEQKGIEKGFEKGIEKGIEKKEMELVINAFKNGISIQIISNITNLSIEKVHSILLNAGLK